MFNTMTLTKAAGALIGALLFLLLANWFVGGLYQVGAGEEGGAEGEEQAQAYSIPVPEAGAASDSAGSAAQEPQIDFAALMAKADPAAGEKVFGKCKTCHKLTGSNAVGPYLNGVVGRAVASVPDYSYSDAMTAHASEAAEWTPEALQEFLTDPKGVVKGTKMSFAGLKKPEDRADVIAYLESQK